MSKASLIAPIGMSRTIKILERLIGAAVGILIAKEQGDGGACAEALKNPREDLNLISLSSGAAHGVKAGAATI